MQEGAGPRPFDVATRRLIEADPEGWLNWIGLPPDGPVVPIDSDVGTVLAEVDKVLRVDAPTPWIAHLELQANYDAELPSRMLQYNALLLHRHRAVVESTVVLLRPEADGREMSGLYERFGPTGFRTIAFGYHVIRVWERPVEELVNGSLSVVPLAPLAAIEPSQLPDVIHRVESRVRQEASPMTADELWAATFLLLGLRYDAGTAQEVMPNMSWLRESSTYQAILAEGEARGEARGRLDEARQLLLTLGTEKFGPPDQGITTTLERLEDRGELEILHRRLLTAANWPELLAAEPDR